jgi:hypothetical protein
MLICKDLLLSKLNRTLINSVPPIVHDEAREASDSNWSILGKDIHSILSIQQTNALEKVTKKISSLDVNKQVSLINFEIVLSKVFATENVVQQR